ncbi:MAG: hypothetical protein JWP27_2927 [Flaviaesturariibacter sp.]|nr:hypothetical protein [Flaviaesturariibacter sp.]
MKMLSLLLIAVLPILAQAQPADSWKVIHNGKTRLTAHAENATANTITIRRADLAKGAGLQVVYAPGTPSADWIRTIALYAPDDTELATGSGNRFTISNARLRKLFAGRTQLMVYTISLPKDPAKRALVRVRRIHLCTIVLKG